MERSPSFWRAFLGCVLLFPLVGPLTGQTPAFDSVVLSGTTPLVNPTSLQFGPDDRLYVSQRKGLIRAYTIERTPPVDPEDPGTYAVTATETIDVVLDIPNHADTTGAEVVLSPHERQITGIYVTGTAQNPVLYVTSSDPREGAGPSGQDKNLDTNSGIVSRLSWTGTEWEKLDLVRGLPRSEENHSVNGIAFDEAANLLYVCVGGHTNAGAPSNNFAYASEYTYSAAIVTIDLDLIEALPVQDPGGLNPYVYDLPTLDDPTRANLPDGSDPNDPFGGNDGLNMAKLDPGGPVQIYSTGWRNAFDIVLTEGGLLYSIDNGANPGWGGHPIKEGTYLTDDEPPVLATDATNEYKPGEPGSTGPGEGGDAIVNNFDNLHLITGPGYYAGHPNPLRANPAGAGLYTHDGFGKWRTTPYDPLDPNPQPDALPVDWPPVPLELANPVEGDYRNPGVDDGALYTWPTSTNGLAEYTAGNFEGAMQGNLLTVNYANKLFRIDLSTDGTAADQVVEIAGNFAIIPLDVIAQGDADVFPGTIWVCNFISNTITVFEPTDYDGGSGSVCTGADDPLLDEDGDGYHNAEEIAAGTNPCSAASVPPDFDGDFISDGYDPDDDNDGIADLVDPFQLDAGNGLATTLPFEYNLFNDDPGFGFFGLGFTGLMTDGVTDYLDLLEDEPGGASLIAGGTAGLFTVSDIGPASAFGTGNGVQTNAFQMGLAVNASTEPFTLQVQLKGPHLGHPGAVTGERSAGFYLGTGDQDNYLSLTVSAQGGTGGFQVVLESAGVPTVWDYPVAGVLDDSFTDLFLTVDPAAGTVQPKYKSEGGAVTDLGSPLTLSGATLTALQDPASALATGFIATSRDSTPFTQTWDFIRGSTDPVTATATVVVQPGAQIHDSSTFTNGSFQITNTSTGGEMITSVAFDFSTALMPDMVFDPAGTAGDTASKPFSNNSTDDLGTLSHTFLQPHGGVAADGYDRLEVTATGFDPGEQLLFSIDVDPTSIKGSPGIGSDTTGSVSGLELTGTTVTVTFDSGRSETVALFPAVGDETGSENLVRNLGPDPVQLEVLSLGESPGVSPVPQVLVRLTGTPGETVRLLAVEGALEEPSTGLYDVDPYEINTARAVRQVSVTLDAQGEAVVPMALTVTGPGGGIHYLTAATVAADGMTGPLAETEIVLYEGGGTLVPRHRLNAGGSAYTDTLGQDWLADGFFTGGAAGTPVVDPIAATADDVLYQSNRTGASFSYALPMEEGVYSVVLHLAEPSATALPGERIFDVSAEGQTLADIDVVEEAGAALTAATRRLYNVRVEDGTLDLVFTGTTGEALLSAVEVLQEVSFAPDPQLSVGTAEVAFPLTALGESAPVVVVTMENTGDWLAEITSVSLSGTHPGDFAHDLALPQTLLPGEQVDVTLTFTPTAAGLRESVLEIDYANSDAPVSVSLSGTAVPAAGAALYRLNTGGETLASADGMGPDWAEDRADALTGTVLGTATTGTPSALANVTSAGDTTFATAATLTPDGSVSASVPAALFQSERRDPDTAEPGDDAALTYSFPLTNGLYEVRLLLAAIDPALTAPGEQVFDVEAEGNVLFGAVDPFALAAPGSGTQLAAQVLVADGTLDLAFLASAGEPAVQGIEVTYVSPVALLAADATSLDFGSNPAGVESAPLALVLSNPGEVAVEVTALDLQGSQANSFAVQAPALPFTVAPGASAPLELTFTPGTPGLYDDALLAVEHDGANADLSIPLQGLGVLPLPECGAWLSSGGLLIAEGEAPPAYGYWSEATAPAGFTGSGARLWRAGEAPGAVDAAGLQPLTYFFQIEEAGTYELRLRTRSDPADPAPQLWLRVAGATATAVEEGGPQMTDLGSDWFAMYPEASAGGWTWNGSPVAGEAYRLELTFDVPENYTLEVSGGTAGLALDRWALVKAPATLTQAEDPQTPASVRESCPGNQPPALVLPADRLDFDGDAVSLALSAPDPEGDTVFFAVENLPTGLVLDPLSGVISGTLAPDASALAPYTVQVSVTDGSFPAGEASGSFTWDVYRPTAEATVLTRINAGGPELVTSLGTFEEDTYFAPDPGFTFANAVIADIGNTTDDDLYRTERSSTVNFGSFSYAIPVPSEGGYIVRLHLVEIYWGLGGQGGGSGGPDSRRFDVSVEGDLLLDDYSIWTAAGGTGTAVVETFQVSVAGPTLDVFFDAKAAVNGLDRPKISAIEVLQLARAEVNLAPMLDPIADQLSVEGEEVTLPLFAGDDDDDDLFFEAIGLPPGLDIDPDSGLIEGTIGTGAATGSPYSVEVTVSDVRALPKSDTQSFTWTVTEGSLLLASPESHGFGDVARNQSVSFTVALQNTGSEALQVSDLQLTGTGAAAFTVTDAPALPFEVPALDEVDVEITFTPSAEQLFEAALEVTHDGGNGPVLSVALSGTGLPVPDLLEATPDPLVFAQQPLGELSAPFALSLAVNGDEEVEVTAVALTGGDASVFTTSFVEAFTVSPGTPDDRLELQVSPLVPGLLAATVEITHSGDNSPLLVPVEAEGIIPPGVVRVNSGGGAYLAQDNTYFEADRDFSGGSLYADPALEIAGTVDDPLYQYLRFGTFGYSLPVLPEAAYYNVRLHFAEPVYGVPGTLLEFRGAGDRVFDLSVEGSALLEGFDIFVESGAAAIAHVVELGPVKVVDGVLDLQFAGVVDIPVLSALEILPLPAGQPVIFAPASVTGAEDDPVGPLTFTVDDLDTPLADLQLSATSSDKGLIEASTAVFDGTEMERTVTFTPVPNANGGPVELTLTVSDGTQQMAAGFTITLTPVNDAPVITLPAGPLQTATNTALDIVGVSVGDVDAVSDTDPLVVTLSVLRGTLEVAGDVPEGLLPADIVGNSEVSVTLTGTLDALNTTLAAPAGLTYTPGLNLTGADTLEVIANDQGNRGAGGVLDSDHFTGLQILGTPFEEWRSTQVDDSLLQDPAAEASDWSPLSNSDDDRRILLAEFFYGGSTDTFEGDPVVTFTLVEVDETQAAHELTYTQRLEPTGVLLAVERATAFGPEDWAEVPYTVLERTDNLDGTETVTLRIDGGPFPLSDVRVFYRLRIALP